MASTSVHRGDKPPLLMGLWNLHIMELYIGCFSVYLSLSLRDGEMASQGHMVPQIWSLPCIPTLDGQLGSWDSCQPCQAGLWAQALFWSLGPVRSGWTGGKWVWWAKSLAPAAALETCLPQNSKNFKNNRQLLFAFCFKRHFFPLCKEQRSSRKVRLPWQLRGAGVAGEGPKPGVCAPPGS